MGYPTTIQAIERKKLRQAQWYVNFPNALAQAMNFSKGEVVEWEVEDINTLKIVRVERKSKRRRAKS